MPLKYRSQLTHSKAGREQLVFAQFRFYMFHSDLRGLGCAGQRAGHNQIRSQLETREKLRDSAHFFFTKISQRALIIRFFPVRPIGFAVTKEIKLHGTDGKGYITCKTETSSCLVRFNFCKRLTFSTVFRVHMIRHFTRRVHGSTCQRRTPPRKAFRLCPKSMPSGSWSNFFALPPPRTT